MKHLETGCIAEAEICLENVTENFKTFKGYMNPTVCHGIAGNAELYLEAYRIFNDNKYFKLAKQQALMRSFILKKAEEITIQVTLMQAIQKITVSLSGTQALGTFF